MKKNIIVILLIPFLIAILGVVTITSTFNLVDADIAAIEWGYRDVEGFKLTNSANGYVLHAEGVNQRGSEAINNSLKWSVINKNEGEEEHAEIKVVNNQTYLVTKSAGEVIVTCSNEKGSVYRSMTVLIYETGAVLINTDIKASGSNIDPYIYIGNTDLKEGMEVDAEFKLNVTVLPNEMMKHLKVVSQTDNFTYDISTGIIKFNREIMPGEATLELGFDDESGIISSTFKFKIVDGINVYTYSDLKYISENAKVAVLRKSFESLENTYKLNAEGKITIVDDNPVYKANNVECFGDVDLKTSKVTFTKDTLYHYSTTYNNRFIEQWNKQIAQLGSKNTISDQLYVGLRLQNDLYGNGYTINFHNLTYPSGGSEIVLEDDTVLFVPEPAKEDIFKGPLPFYSLGDHNGMTLIEALGQDNCGLLIDGDGILVDDVTVKNCDFGSFFDILNYVGTVIEVMGDNITIKNSRVQNGKNVIRSFSNMDLMIDNCLLQYAKCFLVMTGCNEFVDLNTNRTMDYYNTDGTMKRYTLNDYLKPYSMGDNLVNQFLEGTFTSKELMRTSLLKLQEGLNNADHLPTEFKSTMTIKDTMFYYASVSSIGSEVLFNGPYLYSQIPSKVSELLGLLPTQDGIKISEIKTNNISGISYRSKVDVVGKCKFYNFQTIDLDHNTVDGLDISGLINENITKMAASIGEQYAVEVNIDKFFPIKDYLYTKASPSRLITRADGKQYINVIAAWYGGGTNNNEINFDAELVKSMGQEMEIDLLDTYLNLTNTGSMITYYKNMMMKAVTVVIGTEPFKFRCAKENYLWDLDENKPQTPNVQELMKNARSE